MDWGVKEGAIRGRRPPKKFSHIIKNIKSMGYIRIIVDSKCDTNFDVGNGDGGSGGNSSSRGEVDMCGCVDSSKRRRVKPKENSLTLAALALGPDAAATEEAAQVYCHQSLSSLVTSQSIGNIRALLLLLTVWLG